MTFCWPMKPAGVALMLLLASCGNAQDSAATDIPSNQSASSASGSTAQTNPDVEKAHSLPADTASAPTSVQSYFQKALANGPWGEPAILSQPLPAQGDMSCSPDAITGSARSFAVRLPKKVEDRRHHFVAITPSGAIMTIYAPNDQDKQDVFYNNPISWQTINENNEFSLTAESFDGRAPNSTEPMGIFLQAGIYVLALVNDPSIAGTAGQRNNPTVYASCSIRYTP